MICTFIGEGYMAPGLVNTAISLNTAVPFSPGDSLRQVTSFVLFLPNGRSTERTVTYLWYLWLYDYLNETFSQTDGD
jgi:hypothetical protein